ncbi:recombinase family protein, partial [Bradyrhizobium brasilense]|nr:recombinase family protein [Bradyrhizobium brasilense]
ALAEPDGGREAVEALRSLIGEIVLNPGKKRGEVLAELRGELMGILEFSNTQENQRTKRLMPAVAARPRNQRFLRKQGTQDLGFRKNVGVFLFAAHRKNAARSPRSTIASSASSGTNVT